MRVILLKKHITSLYSGEFDIYKYIEYMNVPRTNFELPHKYETYEEYEHLLNSIRLGFIDIDRVTEFKDINKEELMKDVERYKDENMFR